MVSEVEYVIHPKIQDSKYLVLFTQGWTILRHYTTVFVGWV